MYHSNFCLFIKTFNYFAKQCVLQNSFDAGYKNNQTGEIIFELTKVHNKHDSKFLIQHKLFCSVLIKNSHHISSTIDESSFH